MYSGDGGDGSRVPARSVCTQPSSPAATAARAATKPASNRRWKPICTGTADIRTFSSTTRVPAASGGDRLLAEHRDARVDRAENQGRVGVGGGRDHQTVDTGGEKIVRRRNGLGAQFGRDVSCPGRHGVRDHHAVDLVDLGECPRVVRPDPADPGNPDSHRRTPLAVVTP